MNRDQLVAGGVAIAAFACSAQHIYQVAYDSGNPVPIALVHPLGLDGLIYIGMRAVQNGRRWQGWLATVYGVAMSLTFNAVSYADIAMPPAVMAVAMPLALVLAVLVIGHTVSRKAVPAPKRASRAGVPVSRFETPADVVAVPGRDGAVSWVKDTDAADKRAKAFAMLDEGRDKADAAAAVGCSVRTLNRWIAAR